LSFSALKAALADYCSADQKHRCGGKGHHERMKYLCFMSKPSDYATPKEFYDTFPSFTFVMDGNLDWNWKPSSYLYDDGDVNEICLGLQPLK
jgi:hypothetical protein